MTMSIRVAGVLAAAVLAVGCASDGMSRAEVDAAIVEAIENHAADVQYVTAGEVQEAIDDAVEGLAPTGSGLSMDEVQAAIDGAMSSAEPDSAPADESAMTAPPRSDTAAYTQYVVSYAIDLYEQEGLDALLAYANDPQNVDDQWYVFVADENDALIGHYDPERLGLDLKGWVGTDVNGFEFGTKMLSATEDGKWVGYVYLNPATERAGVVFDATNFELKNAWVVRHDGLLFGSGWYINAVDFIPEIVDEIGQRLGDTGFEATIAYFADPQKITAGLPETVAYYNSTESVLGSWLAFYAQPDGTVLFFDGPDDPDGNIVNLLGSAVLDVGPQSAWITEADNPDGEGPSSMRIRAILGGDVLFGAGWYSP